MATVQVNAPFQFQDVQGTLGHAYLFAQQGILLELQDRLNVLGLGVVGLVGDVMGTGTGFHADEAARDVRETALELTTAELDLQRDRAARVKADEMEAVLTQINTDRGNGDVC